jgi:uncharacterized protein (TIGR02588 family)
MMDRQVVEREDRGQRSGSREGRPAGRKVAEWVTMGVSLVLVLGVAGFLVYEGMNGDGVFVEADVKVLVEQAVERGGKYVVPIRVENRARRTLKDFQVRVTYRSAGGEKESEDVVIDYVGEREGATVYVYIDRHPRGAGVEARATGYRLE